MSIPLLAALLAIIATSPFHIRPYSGQCRVDRCPGTERAHGRACTAAALDHCRVSIPL